jgi:hypothetical protein
MGVALLVVSALTCAVAVALVADVRRHLLDEGDSVTFEGGETAVARGARPEKSA